MTDTPQHVYVVREISDGVLRRTHGFYTSLQGAFAYCETEERKKPLIDGVRFELFPDPGGEQWLIHQYYGPKDDWPETSHFVISQHEVIRDVPATVPSAPVDRAAVLREAIDAAREEGHRLEAEQGIEAARGARSVAYLLRKILVKADMPVDWAVVAYRSPGTRTLYCVTCARQETGWRPVTADTLPDGDTVCDFCGGRVLAVACRTLGDVVARYMPADGPSRMADEEQRPETQAEDPARIDRLRPEFSEHASVESIDVQIQRARRQRRLWDSRVQKLTDLRQNRVAQKEAGAWPPPAAVAEPGKEA